MIFHTRNKINLPNILGNDVYIHITHISLFLYWQQNKTAKYNLLIISKHFSEKIYVSSIWKKYSHLHQNNRAWDWRQWHKQQRLRHKRPAACPTKVLVVSVFDQTNILKATRIHFLNIVSLDQIWKRLRWKWIVRMNRLIAI